MATSPRPSIDNELASPRGIGYHRVSGFVPSMTWSVHNNINSNEVCRVLVLRCQSPSNYTCPVLFHRVTCHMQFTWSFIHACIHASKHQYFHTFTHSSVHNAHIHTISIHTWLHQSPKVWSGHISSNQSSIVPSGMSYITDSLRFIFLSSKWQVLHNGQLEVYFCLSSKW